MAGLLGIGGGFIIVPVLLFLLPKSGVPADILMHACIGTSLATICITSISSFRSHHKRGSVDWQYFKLLVPGIVVGALLSGVVADFLASDVLAYIFGAGAMVMALQIWFSKQPEAAVEKSGAMTIFAVASGIGCGSGLVGIGGGSLVVPYLHYLGERITRCVGTASACGLPIALAGTASYVVMGWNASMPEFSLGYIHLPAFLGIIVASSLTAPLGVRLAHWLPAQQLKKVFAVFLLLVGIRIIINHLG
nr:sulfite exporter TauE/SafE family protein [Pleionea sediminis]